MNHSSSDASVSSLLAPPPAKMLAEFNPKFCAILSKRSILVPRQQWRLFEAAHLANWLQQQRGE